MSDYINCKPRPATEEELEEICKELVEWAKTNQGRHAILSAIVHDEWNSPEKDNEQQ